jgi:hypothetical protein
LLLHFIGFSAPPRCSSIPSKIPFHFSSLWQPIVGPRHWAIKAGNEEEEEEASEEKVEGRNGEEGDIWRVKVREEFTYRFSRYLLYISTAVTKK